MSRLAAWWRRVFGEPPPLEHSSMRESQRSVELPPERQAIIDDLTRRQHAQANEITAETGQAYITRATRARQDGEAIRRERQTWERWGKT